MPQPPINYNQLQDEEEEPLSSSEQVVDNVDKSQAQSSAQSHQQSQSSLKRQVDAQGQLANGNPAKRPRLGNANGLENGAETATSPMDVDHHQSDNHAYPSPLEGEQAPTPAPRTEGPDHATQTDKVEDLEPKTVYLRLANDDSASSVAATPTADASHLRSLQNPILLQCEWNPKDPTRLAAAGTDALARVWTVSRATGPEQVADHVDHRDPSWPSISLVNDEFPSNSKVTAFSWASDGKQIAVATDDDQRARIDLWGLEGKPLHHWEGFETPVVKLRCNPVNRYILSVSPSASKNASNQPDGWDVTLLPSPSASPVVYSLSGHDIFLDETDVTWMNETDFLLCVGTKLVQLRYTGDSIVQVREFATRPDDPLTAVQYDGTQDAGCIAAATSSGHIDVSQDHARSVPIFCLPLLMKFSKIWDASGERRSGSNDAPAHDGRISVLEWQPARPDSERLLASGGEDGIIAIRDVRFADNKPKFEMTIDDDNPILALSFTPDGEFVAGATRNKVLIWKVGEYASPQASWTRKSQPGRLSPKVNGTAEVEDQHCLCWDSEGRRLAFGVNDLVSHL